MSERMTGSVNIQFFIAGIIQGSKTDTAVFDQDYRNVIKEILAGTFPDCRIICPVENHPASVSYSTEKAASVFHDHVRIAAESDMLVVYLPEASMGSSIEMWEARRHGIPIVSITPMQANWVVRILSNKICPSLACFRSFVNSGECADLIDAIGGERE